MNAVTLSPATPRGHRVRELVYAYHSLRGSDGRVVDVPSVALNTPRNAAAVLALLIADQPVEVFGVACLSTRDRLLAGIACASRSPRSIISRASTSSRIPRRRRTTRSR